MHRALRLRLAVQHEHQRPLGHDHEERLHDAVRRRGVAERAEQLLRERAAADVQHDGAGGELRECAAGDDVSHDDE